MYIHTPLVPVTVFGVIIRPFLLFSRAIGRLVNEKYYADKKLHVFLLQLCTYELIWHCFARDRLVKGGSVF